MQDDEWKLTGKNKKLKTNIKLLDKILEKIIKKNYIDNNLYEGQQEHWGVIIKEWFIKIKTDIPDLENVDDEDDNHPIQQFNCPPFIQAAMRRTYVGVKFGNRWRLVVSCVRKMEGEKYIEFSVGGKFEYVINLLILLKVSGKNVDSLLKKVIFEALNRKYETNITSIELAGVENIVKNCLNILNCADERLVSRHILLAGPPGCGKSEIVKKLIKKTPDWIHYTLSNDINDWEGFMKNLNKIMGYLDKRIMIIIDEIDEIATSRDINESKVYDLLRVLDGINDMGHIKFVATTNRPKVLDPALKRIGRFGPIVVMDYPDKETYFKIVKFYADRYDAKDIDIERIYLEKSEAVGSEIRAAFEDCIIHKEEITTENIIENLSKLEKSKAMELKDFVKV